jgi:hypothetical protein
MQVRQVAMRKRQKRVMTKAGWRGRKDNRVFFESDDAMRFATDGNAEGVGCEPSREEGSELGGKGSMRLVGQLEGEIDGLAEEGTTKPPVGRVVGIVVGIVVTGAIEGLKEGELVLVELGQILGLVEGGLVGVAVGPTDGATVGRALGS